jgi:hypothetical protein
MEKIKSIGVLTYHNVTNYGAVFQALCLQEKLKKISADAEVEIINYTPPLATKFYLKKHLLKRREIDYIGKMVQFKKFRNKYLNVNRIKCRNEPELRRATKQYDLIIVGSDEVWKIGKIRGWDPNYLLRFVEGEKQIRASYAASSSLATDFSGHEREVEALLKQFSHISVRDKHTLDLVSKFYSGDVTEVVDPTLLFNLDEIVPNFTLIEKPYILMYANSNSKEMELVRAYAKMYDYLIVSIGHNNPRSDFVYLRANPEEWLNLIRHAELVMTNYYHGMLLSIRCGKNFIPMYNKTKMGKISDIAKKLGFEDKIVKTFQGKSINSLIVSPANMMEQLSVLIDASEEYLRQVLLRG